MKNQLKAMMQEGRKAIGTFVTNPTPDLVEIVALGGFDFIVIDMEHGDLSVETAKGLVRAAEYRGITPIIRVTKNVDTHILRALDVGAHGVQVPMVNSREDAEYAIRSAKYYPKGTRGLALARSADYGAVNAFEYFESANRETMVVFHCENKIGYDHLEEILALEDVDVAFLGPFDMSQSLGIPGQVHHPDVEAIAQGVIDKARAYGKAAGIFVSTAEEANRRFEQGFQYVTLQMFDTFILNAAKAETAKLVK